MKPFLAGLTLIEEMETDICVDEVDERTAKVYNEFSSGQRTSETLKAPPFLGHPFPGSVFGIFLQNRTKIHGM